jgi:hypothetical protein
MATFPGALFGALKQLARPATPWRRAGVARRLTSVGAPHVMGVNKNKNAMHNFPGRF